MGRPAAIFFMISSTQAYLQMSYSSSPSLQPLRQTDVDRHVGTREDFLIRHTLTTQEAVRQGPAAIREVVSRLFSRVADTRNLRIAWDWQARRRDVAPGPDGWLPEEFSESAVWRLLRRLSKIIQAESYVRGEVRVVQIPKGAGRSGTRALKLFDLVDKVVQRSIVQIIQPLLDPQFDDHSFGGRPGRGPFHALARANVLMQRQQRCVWITEDVRDCFEQIFLPRLLQIVRRYLPDDRLIRLIECCIRRTSDKGLDQGAPLAPLLTNQYVHHLLDRPWRNQFPLIPLLRFIDDLLVMCTSFEEAQATDAKLRRLMQDAGLPLKGAPEHSIKDLRNGQSAHWLGYVISYGPLGLEFRLPAGKETGEKYGDWLDHLRASLALAHEKPDAPLRALHVVEGLIVHAGPCLPFTDSQQLYDCMVKAAGEFGFEEMPSLASFMNMWNRAHKRWCRIRRTALRQYDLQCRGAAEPPASAAKPSSTQASTTEKFVLYTDGCCLRSGVGGWAFHLQGRRAPVKKYGGLRRTSSSRAELTAAIQGLESVPVGAAVCLVSDSEYVVLGIGQRLLGWKARGWRRAGGGRLRNLRLWQNLDALVQQRRVTCHWVRGHAGHPQNEACDQRANYAAVQQERQIRAVTNSHGTKEF